MANGFANRTFYLVVTGCLKSLVDTGSQGMHYQEASVARLVAW